MTASYTPLTPVGDAVYNVLTSDSTLTTLAPGGVWTDVPQNPTFPMVWLEVIEDAQHGGYGTKPGREALPEVQIRVHVYQGDYGTMRDAQIVMARVIALLADPPVVIGYTRIGIFHEETVPLPFELLNNVKVVELIAFFRLFVAEAA